MSPPRVTISPEAIHEALHRHAGNKSAIATEMGMHRSTLRRLMAEYGIADKPIAGGTIRPDRPNVLPLPPKGKVARYLLTSAQNNTRVFTAFLQNLEAYSKWLNKRGTCQIMCSRFTYNKTAYQNAYMAKPGKGPTEGDHDQLWYDPAIAPYVCDDPQEHGSGRWELAPDLHWCAEINVLPTDPNPLSGFKTYTGTASAIFPHAKVAMLSAIRLKGEEARFLYTTGTVTQLNYIQRKAGQKAQFHHVYGALLVEVDHNGDWWARQINADSSGAFYDCPEGNIVKVDYGKITKGHRALAINWGDVHASECDPQVAEVNWGRGGAIDKLKPLKQFMHDLFSMRSQSHHEMRLFGRRYYKWLKGQDVVSKEVEQTRDLMQKAHRNFCEMIVVNSNHDRHGERWLDEADFRADLPNAKFFLDAQRARVYAMEQGNHGWMFLEWAVRRIGCPKVRFLGLDESCVIGPRNHRVQCGMHGDIAGDGARGSPAGFAALGMRNTLGHKHGAGIFQGTVYAGVCQLDMDYAKGASSWSVSHVPTWPNGKRCVLSQRAGKLWA